MTVPMTPSDCDLSDFAFMPLDVQRLRDSELASNETPEACWAAVLIWAASWHQVPAASIPNDDKWIAKQAGYALRGKIDRAWAKVRAGALRGWIECTDGRLYHPVVAEKAVDAWRAKLEQRWRSECSRIKKHNERHLTNLAKPTFGEWVLLGCPQGHMLPVPGDTTPGPPSVAGESASKGQGEGQGQGDSKDSVPSGTGAAGADPPPKPKVTNPDEIIFGYGVPLLVSAGSEDKHARSFLGGLRKAHGDAKVIDTLRDCIRAKPLQPLEWIAKALPPPAIETPAETEEARRAATTAEARKRVFGASEEVVDA